jgi:DNA polymerase
MDARRRSYLRALDIDVWERRTLPAANSDPQAANHPAAIAAVGAQPSADLAQLQERERANLPAALPRLVSVPDGAVQARATVDNTMRMDWSELETAVKNCTLCPLHLTRTQGVFGVGNRTARWMIIGEAPGADEDRQGEPFVGRAGQLLNSMLKAIGLRREEVFIANILKSRPPNNRDPKAEEVQACIPYLFRQVELIDPTLILCVGRIAAQTLLDTTTTIGKLRGRVHQLASGRPMIVTYHPAYLLRSPVEKRKAWADLVLAMQTFDRLSQA